MSDVGVGEAGWVVSLAVSVNKSASKARFHGAAILGILSWLMGVLLSEKKRDVLQRDTDREREIAWTIIK